MRVSGELISISITSRLGLFKIRLGVVVELENFSFFGCEVLCRLGFVVTAYLWLKYA